MNCHALCFIRLSKNLESIGVFALYLCRSLEALFLPSTVKAIEENAFAGCESLRLLILPNDIHLSNVSKGIIFGTAIKEAVVAAGVMHEYDFNENWRYNKSSCLVNKWLYHHMDGWPFHKLCYNSSITTKDIIEYLNNNGKNSTLQGDKIHGMGPLHMLSMNPHAPSDSISSLLNSNMDAVFFVDNQQKSPLDYARDYNVGGLVGIINGLCNHRRTA